MSQTIPEILKTHETAYAEKLAEYERAKEAYNKAQFELMTAGNAAFEAFKKWSSVKEQFLVELVNNRSAHSQTNQDASRSSDKSEV